MKVLVISHNPLCTYNGMGKTLSSLFSCFPCEELCQLYIYPSFPDRDLCSSYFRITDKDVLRSLTHFSQPGGEIDKTIISPDQPPFEQLNDEVLYRRTRNKTPIRRLERDAMWKISRWNNERLWNWLDREAPTCVFVAPGPACFLYDLALTISIKRKIPIVTYICDEYYFLQRAKDVPGKLHQRMVRERMEKLMKHSSGLVVISEELRKAYQPYFSVPTRVLMTGKTIASSCGNKTEKPAVSLSFFGNVRSGRYLSLRRIGEILDSLSIEKGKQYTLHVYAKENDQHILESLCQPKSIVFHDFVQGEEFSAAFFSAELLVHVESFCDDMIDRVRHSVSTKVADSLASGIPLLAFGPAGLASIEHLRRNECAFVCTDPDRLRDVLLKAMNDLQARKEVVEHAINTAEQYHNEKRNSMELHELLSMVGGVSQ